MPKTELTDEFLTGVIFESNSLDLYSLSEFYDQMKKANPRPGRINALIRYKNEFLAQLYKDKLVEFMRQFGVSVQPTIRAGSEKLVIFL